LFQPGADFKESDLNIRFAKRRQILAHFMLDLNLLGRVRSKHGEGRPDRHIPGGVVRIMEGFRPPRLVCYPHDLGGLQLPPEFHNRAAQRKAHGLRDPLRFGMARIADRHTHGGDLLADHPADPSGADSSFLGLRPRPLFICGARRRTGAPVLLPDFQLIQVVHRPFTAVRRGSDSRHFFADHPGRLVFPGGFQFREGIARLLARGFHAIAVAFTGGVVAFAFIAQEIPATRA